MVELYMTTSGMSAPARAFDNKLTAKAQRPPFSQALMAAL